MGGNVTGVDVLLTGLPRGGTTLATELLGGLPDCVAVDEPMDMGHFLQGAVGQRSVKRSIFGFRSDRPAAAPDVQRIADNVMEFCRQARSSVLSDGTVVSKHVDGGVYGTKVADVLRSDGKRTELARRGQIHIDKPLTENFVLFVKHNSAFSAILPALQERAPLFAIVRNPLAVLASWNTVPFAVGRGHATFAERFNPDLEQALAARADLLDRQLYLLDWFFGQFARNLDRSDIVRYEDIVASEGRALSAIHPGGGQIRARLASRNHARVYDSDLMRVLGDRLLESDGSYWELYERNEVVDLIPA
jgi:hypothetical protein